MKIGLLIIATNKYVEFLQPLISGADKFFLKNHEVTYFVFTNQDINIESDRPVVKIETQHKNWPWMTLGRYKIFSENLKTLEQMDYLYYIDADMLIVDEVGDEIFGELVVTKHPGYYRGGDWRENRPESKAFIPLNKPIQYYAGGFNGGSSNEYLKMAKIISDNIDDDFNRGVIAVWHDESHLNKYISDFFTMSGMYTSDIILKILTPSYCYGEHMNLPFTKKIVALTKKHEELRS